MKIAERIVMVLLVMALFGMGAWLYLSVQHEEVSLRESVARGEFSITNEPEKPVATEAEVPDWQTIYPNTVPLLIGGVSVVASVADSLPERIKGLSDTPYLPDSVVKLFAFGVAGEHSIWMKDMNYAIDILWVDRDGVIVHIKERVGPETYPNSFSSPQPAWFVVETAAGFAEVNNIAIGDEVVLPVREAPENNPLLTPMIEEAAE